MNLVITGGRGMLAQAVSRVAREHGHQTFAPGHDALDVTDAAAVHMLLRERAPDAVIQCAAYTSVDQAESERDLAFAVNAQGAGHVARACADLGATVVYPSTDYVFAGRATRPYRPGDETDPLNVYGASKVAGEQAVRAAARHYVVRSSWLYGAGGRNFVGTILQRARAGEPLRVVRDQHGSPTWTRDLAQTLLLLLERAAPAGTYHACNRGETTWYDLACTALQLAGVHASVTPVEGSEFQRPARRPAYSVLDSSATEDIVGPARTWQDALRAALAEGL
ncbi:MAG: dTDP-4-dehydrorhamnose reductase [Pseudomonas sp.]